jgi:hypothetical protein
MSQFDQLTSPGDANMLRSVLTRAELPRASVIPCELAKIQLNQVVIQHPGTRTNVGSRQMRPL